MEFVRRIFESRNSQKFHLDFSPKSLRLFAHTKLAKHARLNRAQKSMTAEAGETTTEILVNLPSFRHSRALSEFHDATHRHRTDYA